MSLVHNTRLFFLLCCFANGSLFFGQCDCTIDIIDNSQPSYLLSSGETACIYADVVYTGVITLQGGTLCNYGTIESDELIFESGEINNYGHITVQGLFNVGANSVLNNNQEFETETLLNYGTINLGQKAFLGAFNLYNYATALLKGAESIDGDSTNYSMVFVSEISENTGNIEGHLVFKDLSYYGTSIYRIDDIFGSEHLIDYPKVLFEVGTSDTGPRGPKSCPYSILLFPNSNFTFCSGASMNFGASLIYTSGNLITYIAPSIPFVWTVSPAQPSGISSGTYNDAYDIYGATSSYVLNASTTYGTCFVSSSPIIATMKNLIASAGTSTFIPYGDQATIGGIPIATGGTPPYSCLWTPSSPFLLGTTNTSEHPVVSPAVTTVYSLSVSDANTSCVSTSTMVVIVEQNPHAVLKRDIDGGYYKVKADNTIYFKYDDEYKNNNVVLNYKIYRQDHANSASFYTCSPLTPFYGDNRFALNLTACSQALTTGQFYVLEVQNEKKEKFYLKFYY